MSAPVPDLAAFTAIVDAVKARAGAYITNLYAPPPKLQDWIARRELNCLETAGCALFFRKDRWFRHLYFCAADPSALTLALGRLEGAGTLTLDLLGHAAQVEELSVRFEPAGFRNFARLTRLARIASPGGPAPEGAVELATAADVAAILGKLEACFDPLKEQLPSREELAGAVAVGRILLLRDGPGLAGLLYFAEQGATSTLRYWLVDPGHRDRGIGATLIRDYFGRNPAARRYLLWVLDANADALSKYGHYGYAPDGLVDQVMLREPNP